MMAQWLTVSTSSGWYATLIPLESMGHRMCIGVLMNLGTQVYKSLIEEIRFHKSEGTLSLLSVSFFLFNMSLAVHWQRLMMTFEQPCYKMWQDEPVLLFKWSISVDKR